MAKGQGQLTYSRVEWGGGRIGYDEKNISQMLIAGHRTKAGIVGVCTTRMKKGTQLCRFYGESAKPFLALFVRMQAMLP